MRRYATAFVLLLVAVALTVYLDVTNPGLCPLMGAAVAAWLALSYEIATALP